MIGIVDYGMGNLHSVRKAIERLGYEAVVTADAAKLASCSAAVLPGVGAFGDAMRELRASGLDRAVIGFAASGRPLLGICLGMQLLFEESEEFGRHEGLGLLPGRVVRFDAGLKVPHMGWNELCLERPDHPLFAGFSGGYVYFVHSYHACVGCRDDLLATTDYGGPVAAVVGRGNVFGMQFHPEKSGAVGIALLANFLRLTG
ncbi:MAG: imidazole glycerol phosphate synthase subunit HisH [Candidatus Reconcilbacillus cellulovorans]|uniref:Imidazole glycerol phosphate synthase subunit HisH n=1 Tax=Candidatus Reconcilbacillus cellulovorans TaxID=1906605 RepID=A0A2A6E353_9BACL|nr:MAG: imidazole glycerol phosphate synthase subunit HisH [Candidatus Reconcilbacillus cellulovorans]